MEILRDEEGTTIEQQFEDEFGTLDNTAFLTGEGVHGIDRAKRIWLTLPDDIQGKYGNFMNFFESTDWHGINMKKGGVAKKKMMAGGGMPKKKGYAAGGMKKGYAAGGRVTMKRSTARGK